MNVYRTFTMRHTGEALVLRADAVYAFMTDEHGGTRIYLAGNPDGFVVTEAREDVYRILESETHG